MTVAALRASCPRLFDPALEVAAVGSTALFEACQRAALPLPPVPNDIDLAWRPGPEEGRALLASWGLEAAATTGALGRGTLGVTIAGSRVELTSYRGGGATTAQRIAEDARLRDMTIGALYLCLWNDKVADPTRGLDDWRAGIIRAPGDAAERIREHPVRALRYVRRAVELGFRIEPVTRRAIAATAREVAAALLPEALAEEIRKVLATCSSPGAFFQICAEESLLEHILPELAPQFDGRPAGRLEWHPEISQALHMVLVLRSAARVATRDGLDASDRARLLLAALCHDLGKGRTLDGELPSHHGHEAAGVPCVERLFTRLPALGSKRTKRLCKVAARTHLMLASLRDLRVGTLVDLWSDDLAPNRQDLRLLALVVRCDKEGRLEPEQLGLPRPPQAPPATDYDALEERIHEGLEELDRILRAVSGEESARLYASDPAALRRHLRDARCRALAVSGFFRGGAEPRR